MKNWLSRIVLSVSLIFLSCGIKYHYPLSEFKLNGKTKNHYIQNRKPEWGDGNRDGCVVSPEISLNLNISNNSINGKVIDTQTLQGLDYAYIDLEFDDKKIILIKANRDGEFSSNATNKLKSIKVQYIGYRELNIKL